MRNSIRFVSAAAMTAGVALVGIASGTAAAQGPSYQGGNCPPGVTCTHWFPGDPPPPGSQVLTWDWHVPHDWYWNSEGIVDVATNVIYPWNGTPHQAAPPPAPGVICGSDLFTGMPINCGR